MSTTSVALTVDLCVQLPRLPNYLRNGDQVLDVARFSDAQLRMMAAVWTDALVAHAQARRMTGNDGR